MKPAMKPTLEARHERDDTPAKWRPCGHAARRLGLGGGQCGLGQNLCFGFASGAPDVGGRGARAAFMPDLYALGRRRNARATV